MPPTSPAPAPFTLRQLNLLVRDAVATALPGEYWVEAELSECRERGGHCYMELVEKDPRSATPLARAAAKCWRSTWQTVQPYFERTTSQPLRAGLKVLLKVYAQFHEAYGFSWIVTDIDPTYTLGDMARRRQEIVRQLKAEGVFDLQRDLRLPTFCQRIAVISAPEAAGYGDFCRQLQDNDLGLRFSVTLFPATMQGAQTEPSIIAALNAIFATVPSGSPEGPSSPSVGYAATPSQPPSSPSEAPPFDCVVIIRGGGATADLSGFDTLALAENVAQFPLPVITGIGHDRDETILDMVSHLRVKTPTAAAAHLIDHLAQTLRRLDDARQRLSLAVQQRLALQQQRLAQLQALIPTLAQRRLSDQRHRIDLLSTRLPVALDRRLTDQRHRLDRLALLLQGFDPQVLLARGYSITLHNGRALRDPSALRPGDLLETRLAQGTLHSVVTASHPVPASPN